MKAQIIKFIRDNNNIKAIINAQLQDDYKRRQKNEELIYDDNEERAAREKALKEEYASNTIKNFYGKKKAEKEAILKAKAEQAQEKALKEENASNTIKNFLGKKKAEKEAILIAKAEKAIMKEMEADEKYYFNSQFPIYKDYMNVRDGIKFYNFLLAKLEFEPYSPTRMPTLEKIKKKITDLIEANVDEFKNMGFNLDSLYEGEQMDMEDIINELSTQMLIYENFSKPKLIEFYNNLAIVVGLEPVSQTTSLTKAVLKEGINEVLNKYSNQLAEFGLFSYGGVEYKEPDDERPIRRVTRSMDKK